MFTPRKTADSIIFSYFNPSCHNLLNQQMVQYFELCFITERKMVTQISNENKLLELFNEIYINTTKNPSGIKLLCLENCLIMFQNDDSPEKYSACRSVQKINFF